MTEIINVLIIDDNPDDLYFYEDLLLQSETNYKIYLADTAQEGLDIFKKERIDCALVDFNIPEMDGIAILHNMLKDSRKHKAIVILTGEPHQKIQAEAARIGALNYIVKDVANTSHQIDSIIQKTILWADDMNKIR